MESVGMGKAKAMSWLGTFCGWTTGIGTGMSALGIVCLGAGVCRN